MRAIQIPPDQMYDLLTGRKKEIIRIWDPKDKSGRILICSAGQKMRGYVCGMALCTAEIAKVERYAEGPLDKDPMYGWHLKKMRLIEPFHVQSRNRMSFFDIPDKSVSEIKRTPLQGWFEWFYDPNRYW